jgi:hypothetical protein
MMQRGVYLLSEDDILQISKMVTVFEESVKGLIRRRGQADEFASLEEIEFWRQTSMPLSPDGKDEAIGSFDPGDDIDA